MKTMIKMMIFVVATVFIFGAAYAQFSKPEDAIKYRKSIMFLISQHFKRMGAVVQGKAAYDKDKFSFDADAVKMLSILPWEAAMEPDTDKGDTTLSSAVFNDKAKFLNAAKSFEADTAKLADSAGRGDLNSIKEQFGVVAQNCKSCHEQFRSK